MTNLEKVKSELSFMATDLEWLREYKETDAVTFEDGKDFAV